MSVEDFSIKEMESQKPAVEGMGEYELSGSSSQLRSDAASVALPRAQQETETSARITVHGANEEVGGGASGSSFDASDNGTAAVNTTANESEITNSSMRHVAAGEAPTSATTTIDPTFINKTCPAASQVFAIPEILENILLRLPMLDLLLAQRVDKTFRGVINSSIHIRRALFFEIRPQSESEKNLGAAPEVNPLLRKMLPDKMPDSAIDCTGNLDSDRQEVLDEMHGNDRNPTQFFENCLPMIFDGQLCKRTEILNLSWVDDTPDKQFSIHLPFIVTPRNKTRRLNRKQTHCRASWRRMYPASGHVRVHVVMYAHHHGFGVLSHFCDCESSTMDTIMEVLAPEEAALHRKRRKR